MKLKFLAVLYACIVPAFLYAEDLKLGTRIILTGKTVSVVPESGKISFYGTSRGNSTSILKVNYSGPKGIKVKAFASALTGASVTAKDIKNSYPVSLVTKEKMEEGTQCLPISVESESEKECLSPSSFPPLSSPVCDEIGEEAISQLGQSLGETCNTIWSKENVCSYLVSQMGEGGSVSSEFCALIGDERLNQLVPELSAKFGGIWDKETVCNYLYMLALGGGSFQSAFRATVSSERESFDTYGILRKDACNKKIKGYLVRFIVEIPKEARGQRITLSVKETSYTGERQAALKPVSEGRYAPKPLIMMNYLQSTCGNKISLTRWARNKPVSVKDLDIYALLSYKGMVLALSVIDGLLSGGKGTFELHNSSTSYGACFNLARERQNVNGYPN